MKMLSRPEELVMMAIWHLKDNAYLVSIRDFLSELTGKSWTVGAIYVPLDRLTKAGFTETVMGDSTPERGGRRKKYYHLTRDGLESLHQMQRMHARLWNGFPSFTSEP